jgi:hypothetical protein
MIHPELINKEISKSLSEIEMRNQPAELGGTMEVVEKSYYDLLLRGYPDGLS